MSFILDALKKSESDRARQSGPALFEVKVTRPAASLPPWAIAVLILLAVNLAIGAYLLMRQHSTGRGAAAAPPAREVGAGGAPAARAQPPLPDTLRSPLPGAVPDVRAGASAPGPSIAVPRESAVTEPATVNSDDYAPAAEPAQGALAARSRRGTAVGLPLYPDAPTAQAGGLPALRLDLHVYAARPEERFVMINMRRLKEGDSLPEGVRVEGITPDGAIVVRQGIEYLLPRE